MPNCTFKRPDCPPPYTGVWPSCHKYDCPPECFQSGKDCPRECPCPTDCHSPLPNKCKRPNSCNIKCPDDCRLPRPPHCPVIKRCNECPTDCHSHLPKGCRRRVNCNNKCPTECHSPLPPGCEPVKCPEECKWVHMDVCLKINEKYPCPKEQGWSGSYMPDCKFTPYKIGRTYLPSLHESL